MLTDAQTCCSPMAWGDESVRITAPVPAYLMAAVMLPESSALSSLARIKPKEAVKLHWRDLADRRRRDALASVAELDVRGMIAVATPLPKAKQERGRRKCLEVLLPELEKMGVNTLVLESRVLQMNSKDIELLDALRSKRAVSSIRVEHAYGNDEMCLWIPDLILGAYGDTICGNSRDIWCRSWEAIFSNFTVLEASM